MLNKPSFISSTKSGLSLDGCTYLDVTSMRHLYHNSRSTSKTISEGKFTIIDAQWKNEDSSSSEEEELTNNGNFSISYSGNSLLARRKSRCVTLNNIPKGNPIDSAASTPNTAHSTISLPTPTGVMNMSSSSRFKYNFQQDPKFNKKGRWNCHDYYNGADIKGEIDCSKSDIAIRSRTRTISSNREYANSDDGLKCPYYSDSHLKVDNLLGSPTHNNNYMSIPCARSHRSSSCISPSVSQFSTSPYGKTTTAYSMEMSDDSDHEGRSTPLSDGFAYSPDSTTKVHPKTVYASSTRNNTTTSIATNASLADSGYSEITSRPDRLPSPLSGSHGIVQTTDLINHVEFEKMLNVTPLYDKTFKQLVPNHAHVPTNTPEGCFKQLASSEPFASSSTLKQMDKNRNEGDYNLSSNPSGSNTTLVAIDHKIERAMDLVKTHLMFAVREEVDSLRSRIQELESIAKKLEIENNFLREHISRDVLQQINNQLLNTN